jgi:hypothetical protein
MNKNCQGVQSTQPSLPIPTIEPVWVPDIVDDPMEDVPQESNNTRTHLVLIAIYVINGDLFTNQTGCFPITSIPMTTHMLLSSTYSMPAQFAWFPSRIAQKKSFFVHIARSTPGSHSAASNLYCTHLTMKHPKTSKQLLPWNKLASSTLYWTSIAQTLSNGQYVHGRIILSPGWQDFPNCFPSPTGAASQLNGIPPSTLSMSSKSSTLRK